MRDHTHIEVTSRGRRPPRSPGVWGRLVDNTGLGLYPGQQTFQRVGLQRDNSRRQPKRSLSRRISLQVVIHISSSERDHDGQVGVLPSKALYRLITAARMQGYE